MLLQQILTFTTPWRLIGYINSENRIWHFMQIVSTIGDNLHEMSNPVFWKKIRKNISICCLLKILPRVVSVKLCVAGVYRKNVCKFHEISVKFSSLILRCIVCITCVIVIFWMTGWKWALKRVFSVGKCWHTVISAYFSTGNG